MVVACLSIMALLLLLLLLLLYKYKQVSHAALVPDPGHFSHQSLWPSRLPVCDQTPRSEPAWGGEVVGRYWALTGLLRKTVCSEPA